MNHNVPEMVNEEEILLAKCNITMKSEEKVGECFVRKEPITDKISHNKYTSSFPVVIEDIGAEYGRLNTENSFSHFYSRCEETLSKCSNNT